MSDVPTPFVSRARSESRDISAQLRELAHSTSTLRRGNQPLSPSQLTRAYSLAPLPRVPDISMSSSAGAVRPSQEPRVEAIDLTGSASSAGGSSAPMSTSPALPPSASMQSDPSFLPVPLSLPVVPQPPSSIASVAPAPSAGSTAMARLIQESIDLYAESPTPLFYPLSPPPMPSAASPAAPTVIATSSGSGVNSVGGAGSAPSALPLYFERDVFDMALPAPTAVQSRDAHQFVSTHQPYCRHSTARPTCC